MGLKCRLLIVRTSIQIDIWPVCLRASPKPVMLISKADHSADCWRKAPITSSQPTARYLPAVLERACSLRAENSPAAQLDSRAVPTSWPASQSNLQAHPLIFL